jgi:L-alanine-DL-glutamate epimerase-like enolase superfamily enzyme
MRVRSVETFSVGLPFKERYVTASGSLERREMTILRLTSDAGARGHGDAVPLTLRGGPSMLDVVADLEGPCRQVLEEAEAGDAAGIERLLGECASLGAGRQALAAVDAALLDLLGRETGTPAYGLLGAGDARPVPCNGTIGADDPAVAARAARELAAAGFGTVKLKVGTGGDRERVEAVRHACGEGVGLRVDANGAWSEEEALEALAELGEGGLELAEQPCATAEETARLRPRVRVPLVLDESVASAADADRAGRLGACDAVTLKLAKVGGVHAALHVAQRVPAYLSSALDSPLGIAAAAHAAQVLPARGFAAGLAHGLATSGLFADNVADDAGLRGPEITPAGPGLGVEIDDDALRRLALA